jgi:hypothetical protein
MLIAIQNFPRGFLTLPAYITVKEIATKVNLSCRDSVFL